MVQVWASTDPKAAAAFVQKQPSKATLACVVQQWSAVDPAAVLAWADGLAASPFRKQALQEVLEQCAQTAPELAARYALPGDLDQNRIVSKIAEQWIRTDSEAALVWVKSLSESNLGAAARPVLLGLIGRDVTQAADFLLSLSSSHLRDKLHQDLARAWASRDLQGAVVWAQRLPEGYARVLALEAIMPDWAQADPQAATAFALSLPKPDVRLWKALAEEMTMAHPDEVMKWLASLPEGDSQVSARCWVVDNLAQRSPLEAATYISSLPPGKEQDNLARRVAFNWAEYDPRSAAEWVDQFPAGHAHDESALMLVLRWTFQDPAAAVAWYCSAVPNANSVEWAMTTLSSDWACRDPIACAAWLDSIKAPPQSRFLAACVWLDLDREGARAWIERSSFSEEEKEQLLNPKPRP